MSMTENPPITESTSSPSSQKQNVNSKKEKSSQNELETLKTKYDVCKQRLQQSEHRLQQADYKVIQLQAQKEMLEEKLERFKVEVENRELKSKEKNANPSDEMIKRKFEEMFAVKSEQTIQQFRQNIQEELGKCKRKLHEDYEHALNDSKQSLSNEGQKQIRLMTKRIADLEDKVGEENATMPSAKRVRFEDQGDAIKFKDMLKQRQLDFEDHMLKQYQDFKSNHKKQQVAKNLSGGNGQTLIDATPPPTTKKMASQDNSEEECSVNIEALVEAHQNRLEEIGKQLEGVATREELGQLRKEILDKDDFAKLRPIWQSLAKTCQNTSEKHKALEENHLELKRLMEQKINSLKDWTFLDGWLENVTLVRVSGNYFELDPKNVGILRAKKPFPIVATGLPGRRLYYFEVHFHTRQITAMMHVGLMKATGACMDFAANNNGSFYILGSSDNNIPSRQGGFSCNDVVGCGLLILDEKRHIFFTRNGKLWAKPFPLASMQLDQDLYPGVIASTGQQPALTPNFGDKPILPFQFMDANCPKVIDF